MKEFGGRISSIFCKLKIQSVLTPFPRKFVYLYSNARSEHNIELKKKYIFIPVPFTQLADFLTVKNGICLRMSKQSEIYTYTLCGQNAEFLNLLNTKRNLLYIRNQAVPRSKPFPPRL